VKPKKDWDLLVKRCVAEGIAFVSDEQTTSRATRIKNFSEILEESLTEMLAGERGEMQPTRRTVID
jgi:hypothetical protein